MIIFSEGSVEKPNDDTQAGRDDDDVEQRSYATHACQESVRQQCNDTRDTQACQVNLTPDLEPSSQNCQVGNKHLKGSDFVDMGSNITQTLSREGVQNKIC